MCGVGVGVGRTIGKKNLSCGEDVSSRVSRLPVVTAAGVTADPLGVGRRSRVCVWGGGWAVSGVSREEEKTTVHPLRGDCAPAGSVGSEVLTLAPSSPSCRHVSNGKIGKWDPYALFSHSGPQFPHLYVT